MMYRLLLVCLPATCLLHDGHSQPLAATVWAACPALVVQPFGWASGRADGLTPEVAKMIQEGRALLKEGKAKEALVLFEKADEKSEQHPDAHVWVLRTWMDLDRLNDALNDADRMTNEKVDTAGLDYVYGIGSLRRARKLMEAGGNPMLAFGDAIQYLQSAVDRDATTYPDAWLALAHASWYMPELDRALRAIDKAVEYEPQSAVVRSMEGEIHYSMYKELVSNAKEGEEVPKDHAQMALASFARAAELTPNETANAGEQLAIWRQMGNVHTSLKDLPKASESFAEAIAWAPELVNFSELWGKLVVDGDMTQFNATLERGLEGYQRRFGKEGPGSATVLWWLGYGQMTGKQYDVAEASFKESVERNAAFANSWFYVGLTRYYRGDYMAACEGWLAYWESDAQGLVNTILGDEANLLPIVDWTAGMVGKQGYAAGGTLEHLRTAERMNQVLAATKPLNPTYPNNLGLLQRDLGEITWNQDPKPDNEKPVLALFEESLKSYERALGMAPNDPGYLNDTAVLLQYYLGRDLDKAREYYTKAAESAQEWIDRESWKSLPEEQQKAEEDRVRTALKDSEDNLAKLDKGEVGTRGPLAKDKKRKKKP